MGRIRVLVTAFAPVPGSGPDAAALLGMSTALHADMDFVTLKTEALPYVGHFGPARMFRVPVGLGTAAEQREAFARAVGRQLESENYDVVHVRGPLEGRTVAEVRRSSAFRFVYEVGSFPDEAEGPGAERVWNEAHAACMDAADLVLVPTDATARFMSDKGYAGKVGVVHPGVDVEAFDWWPAASGNATRLLYLGTFAADRDLGTLLSAIRVLARDKQPLVALIAGDQDSERRERTRRVVEAFGLADVVTVRGEPRATSLSGLIGAASLCVAPASAAPRFQDFGDLPQPLLEYFACKRPVIAAGVPGVPEVLRDEREGLLYTPGDETTLAEALEALISDRALASKLAETAYDRVRAHFGGGARRRRIAEMYEMLVPGSQQVDAWSESFEREITGSTSVPSRMASSDFGGDLYTSTQTEVPKVDSDLPDTPTRVDE